MADDLILEMEQRMARAQSRYGDFASTHEAMGVALEEWDELKQAVRANALASVEQECLDLAAVLVRLARLMRSTHYTHSRSHK